MIKRPLLCQVVAVVAGKKDMAKKTLTAAHNHLLKPDQISGLEKSYQKVKEESPDFDNEVKLMQTSVTRVCDQVRDELTQLFDVVLTQDAGNCHVRGEIEVDGVVLARDVPVTHLLFLEKQLEDLTTFIAKLPTLDAAEAWQFSDSADAYVSRPHRQAKTQKVPKSIVKVEPTKEHPGQAELISIDEIIGYYTTVKSSGAIPRRQQNEMLARVRKLADAVKAARERANATEIQPRKIGAALLGYVFAGTQATAPEQAA